MNNEEIKKLINSKYPNDYPEEKLNSLDASLDKMTPGIKKSLVKFLQTGDKDNISLLGYSVERLMIEQGMNELAAYLTMDWLIREPDPAIKSLNKGHDLVTF